MCFKYYIAKALKILLNPPSLKNCKIDKNAKVCSGSELTSTRIEEYSYVGHNCFMVNVKIGKYCSIADRCVIGGAIHPMDNVSTSPVFQQGKNVLNKNLAEFPRIKTPLSTIENDVWIGMGCYIKAGVTIHNGAVIGMGSIVTHDVPAYEIWAGNPAKKIRDRFDTDTAQKLLDSEWWNLSTDELKKNKDYLDCPEKFVSEIKLQQQSHEEKK